MEEKLNKLYLRFSLFTEKDRYLAFKKVFELAMEFNKSFGAVILELMLLGESGASFSRCSSILNKRLIRSKNL